MAATRRATAVALFAAAATTGFLYLYFVDPLTSPLAPPCLFTAIFGVRCPGCGSLRALHALAHGDVKAALAFNAPLVYVLPLAGALLLHSLLRKSPSCSPPPD
jgi:uncharacterized protein DUF2752